MKKVNIKERKKVLEKLEQQLEYLNKRSKRFLWYIYNEDLCELDKELENTICWCSATTIKGSCFDEENTDKLIVEFLEDDNESIILDPEIGGYV